MIKTGTHAITAAGEVVLPLVLRNRELKKHTLITDWDTLDALGCVGRDEICTVLKDMCISYDYTNEGMIILSFDREDVEG
jgi:hypothetical protein